ncbi:MAG TPA: hypothetical protein VKB34_18020 [Povalibacter sp.]|nr:hypothetical protein [Povalibacter sp.]
MASKILMTLSAGIVLVLGVMHLVYTFSGSSLLPRDSAVQTAMSQAPLSITKETTVLRAWVGFNGSHALALIAFALIFGFLAIFHTRFLFGSAYLLAVGFAILVGFVVLARLYWFNVPFAGTSIALACYVASVIAARF